MKPPELNGNVVKGSLVIFNQTDDDFDQTVVVQAVSEIGKAVVIGYQHFPLRHHSESVVIPFESSLSPGRYVVHAYAIAEISSRNTIHRQHLLAPQPLVVTVI